MAKDPAFLFYTGDFTTGTQFFTDEQVGKYIRLLMAQHQLGHLEEKHMIMICKTYDKDVFSKFQKDEAGLFFNERLEKEIGKRKAYSDSRAGNRSGKKKEKNISNSYVNHMENKNKDIIINKEKKKRVAREFVPPTKEEVEAYFQENGYDPAIGAKAWNGYNVAKWHDSQGKPVKNWRQKMNNNWFRDEHKIKSTATKMVY